MKHVILLILFTCASSKKIDYFPNVQNSDFKNITPLVYSPSNDYFNHMVKGDSLAKESIYRISTKDLRRISSDEINQELDEALALCYQKNFTEGFSKFNEIYPRYKKYPSFWNQKGTCFYLQGNYKLALLHYNKSRDLDKSYAPPVNNLGVIYLQEGESRKAMLAFKQAADINKFSMTPLFNLAQINLQYGFIDQAFSSFKLFYEKDPTDPDVLVGLANCYLFTQNLQMAVELFEKLDDDYLEKSYIALNYAIALKSLGKEGEAKKVYYQINKNTINDRGYYQRVGNFVGV